MIFNNQNPNDNMQRIGNMNMFGNTMQNHIGGMTMENGASMHNMGNSI